MDASGRCLCGAVTFTAEAVETELHVCHCGMCRRWGGGPSFGVRAGAVQFAGDEHIERYESSAWAERGFCRRCGAGLFYRLKETNEFFLLMGTFDEQARFALADEIFMDEKPAGYDLAGEHPRLTGEEFMASLRQDGGEPP